MSEFRRQVYKSGSDYIKSSVVEFNRIRGYGKQFSHGGAVLMPKKTFDNYIAPSRIIGRQGPLPEPWKETGTFLSPTPILEAIIEKSENMRTIEEKLSVPTGAWDQTMYLIRIWDPASSRLRLPTHESAGANSKFRQGGLTAGGLPEGFISLVDFRTTMIMSSGDEVTYNNVSVCEVVPGKKPPDPTNLGPMAGTLFQLDKLGYPANL